MSKDCVRLGRPLRLLRLQRLGGAHASMHACMQGDIHGELGDIPRELGDIPRELGLARRLA